MHSTGLCVGVSSGIHSTWLNTDHLCHATSPDSIAVVYCVVGIMLSGVRPTGDTNRRCLPWQTSSLFRTYNCIESATHGLCCTSVVFFFTKESLFRESTAEGLKCYVSHGTVCGNVRGAAEYALSRGSNGAQRASNKFSKMAPISDFGIVFSRRA